MYPSIPYLTCFAPNGVCWSSIPSGPGSTSALTWAERRDIIRGGEVQSSSSDVHHVIIIIIAGVMESLKAPCAVPRVFHPLQPWSPQERKTHEQEVCRLPSGSTQEASGTKSSLPCLRYKFINMWAIGGFFITPSSCFYSTKTLTTRRRRRLNTAAASYPVMTAQILLRGSFFAIISALLTACATSHRPTADYQRQICSVTGLRSPELHTPSKNTSLTSLGKPRFLHQKE